jgi:hypothetical protein
VRVDEVDEDDLEPASDQLLLAFANRARLASMRRTELLESRLVPAMPLRIELTVPERRGALALVHLEEGICSDIEAPPQATSVLGALDGSTRLVDAIDPELERPTLKLVRELLELGALRFADS